MPPRTRSNHDRPSTRKRQASNVDETVNKRPKIDDNESKDDQKKRKEKQRKLERQKKVSFFILNILKNEIQY